MLIEDNPGDARLIREMLLGSELRFEHVDRLSAGIERLAQGGVDAVLLDLSLPDAQGLEGFTRLRGRAPEVPIVVLTGLADEGVAVRAVQLGGQDYLFKGHVGADLLVRSVRYAVERERAEQERIRILASERAAWAEAEAERARLQTILESAANGIIYFDAQAGHVSANRSAIELLGQSLPSPFARRQYLGQIYWPDGRPVSEEELLSSRALDGETIPQQEHVVLRPDGRRVPVLGSAAPVRNAQGNVIGAVVVLQDISTLKELERIREEWILAIAHDLRQPVAAITAYANLLEVLAEQHSADPQGQAGAKHILASSRQLHRMIGDLLDVSRLAAGQLKLERRWVDLPGLVNEVVERMAETLRGHAVRVDLQNAIPSIELDSGRVEQALSNLLSNATKYGSAGTAILVQLRSQDDEVQVSVVNQGKGIAPGDMPHLFTRFYRAREGPSTGEAGIGLGLYITKEIVQAHGGRIWTESDPGGRRRSDLPFR